ncbi:MAG: type II toxin-antitoxin system VapC family toxin [Methylohalobius sp.]|nr:type II toxin-antitoxin system VapC family toxin [Methylohalobius sp.]
MGSVLKALFDTNILIDYLNGLEPAREVFGQHSDPAISLVTWMEVLAGARGEKDELVLRAFLSRFEVFPITWEVAERAILKRRKYRLRLPDALIWATAEMHGRVLVTRNTRDFPSEDVSVFFPVSDLNAGEVNGARTARTPAAKTKKAKYNNLGSKLYFIN